MTLWCLTYQRFWALVVAQGPLCPAQACAAFVGDNATAASDVSIRKVKLSCRYRRTTESVWSQRLDVLHNWCALISENVSYGGCSVFHG